MNKQPIKNAFRVFIFIQKEVNRIYSESALQNLEAETLLREYERIIETITTAIASCKLCLKEIEYREIIRKVIVDRIDHAHPWVMD